MNGRVLIVGSIALDDVQTPFGDEEGVLGGAAVFGSISASLCAPVDIVGVVGDDFPEAHFNRLRSRGIDTAGVEVIDGGKTFRWRGRYEGMMEEAITLDTQVNVFSDFRPKIPASFCEDSIVFLANIDPEVQLAVLDQVPDAKLVLCDTMNYWIKSKRDALIEVLKRVDIALMNSTEARMLFDTTSLPKAAASLLDLGLKRAIIKKGEHGVLMFNRDGFFSSPAVPLEEVVDPTGAGDSFAGGFSGFLANAGEISEESMRQAVVVGSCMASFVVEGFSTTRLEEVDAGMLEGRCHSLRGSMNVNRLRIAERTGVAD